MSELRLGTDVGTGAIRIERELAVPMRAGTVLRAELWRLELHTLGSAAEQAQGP